MSDFIFNGISAESMGLRIERYPIIRKPRKRLTPVTIPGRNGNLHISDGSYEDVVIRYECWWKNKNSAYSTGRTAHEIAEWLYAAPVGARLEDTYDSTVFRTATFQGPLDIENILGRFGRVTLEFQCRPEAWLKSAETAVRFTRSGGFLNNATPFVTKPLIHVVGAISGGLRVGNSTLLLIFPGTETHEIWIDCEEQEAWEIVDGVEVSSNAYIDGADFIEIQPGRNDVSFPNSFELVEIYTRAYTL